MARTKRRIGGHKGAYTKLKKQLKKAQWIANERAKKLSAAGLPVRHPRLD